MRGLWIIIVLLAIASVISTYGWLTKEPAIIEERTQLNTQIEGLQAQIQSYQTDNEAQIKYIEFMLKGLQSYYTAAHNYGYAEADYDNAGIFYDESYFSDAKIFADSCDMYYGHSSSYYSDAKALFDRAKGYATTNKTRVLAELHVNLSEYNYRIVNEMHEACEYFSSACDSYDKGYWDTADNQIDMMNEHIEEHDNLVPQQNEYWSKIDALLEDL